MSDTHRVVIRRHANHDDEHHGGSWKIAYADFMTAMMAFFLVMWILSLVPKESLPGIAEYFRQPLMSKIKGEPHASTNTNVIPGGSPTVIPNPPSVQTPTPLINGNPDTRSSLDGNETRSLEDLKERIETLIATNPRLQEFRPQLVLDMTPEGLRIQIVDGQNRPMFATGSARINPDMVVILSELAPTLNEVPNSLSIAGHTDATQYASGDRAYSNWELSSDRANEARRTLVAGGIKDNKVRRIMGLASGMNADQDPYAHANRRISIVVLNRHTENIMRQTYSTVREPNEISTPKPSEQKDPFARAPVSQGAVGQDRLPATQSPWAAVPSMALPGVSLPDAVIPTSPQSTPNAL